MQFEWSSYYVSNIGCHPLCLAKWTLFGRSKTTALFQESERILSILNGTANILASVICQEYLSSVSCTRSRARVVLKREEYECAVKRITNMKILGGIQRISNKNEIGPIAGRVLRQRRPSAPLPVAHQRLVIIQFYKKRKPVNAHRECVFWVWKINKSMISGSMVWYILLFKVVSRAFYSI